MYERSEIGTVALINFSLITGHGFYDENKYDDAYAEYTGERC